MLISRPEANCKLSTALKVPSAGRPAQSWCWRARIAVWGGKRRNKQWEGGSLTAEDFHLAPKVKQQVRGWCTACARRSVFLCSHLMYHMSFPPPKPHCAFDSSPIVSFHPKLLLPVQASLPLDYFPGLVCNERRLISEASLGWIWKWVFEADDHTAVQSEGETHPEWK